MTVDYIWVTVALLGGLGRDTAQQSRTSVLNLIQVAVDSKQRDDSRGNICQHSTYASIYEAIVSIPLAQEDYAAP